MCGPHGRENDSISVREYNFRSLNGNMYVYGANADFISLM